MKKVNLNEVREHKVGDGLPYRKVFDKGVEIEHCFYANMDTGEYHFYKQPLEMVFTDKGEAVLAESKFGVLTVEWME